MPHDRHQTALELPKVLRLLADKTSCEAAARRALELQPYTEYRDVAAAIQRTADISSLTTRYGTPSAGGVRDCETQLRRAQVGARLTIPEILAVCRLLKTIRNVKDWRRQCPDHTTVDFLFEALSPAKGLEEEIDRAIQNEEELADTASPELREIRQKVRRAQLKIREQLDHIIRSPQYAKVLQEAIVTIRDGRFVVPVRAECKGELRGLVHDTSSSGATVFIEPMSVVDANNEIRLLQSQEQQEVERILLALSGEIGQIADLTLESFDALVELDLLFAKSRLADSMKAVVPEIRQDKVIKLIKARHPLIDKNKVVPVDISLGEHFDTLVITGPNTGGKTVVLKTLGLLTLMAACGLLIPAASGSCVPVFTRVLADIGDEQSIEQSLSTFSAHITNIISILQCADQDSLVLTDELGAGTDPSEGAALAVSIIEHLRAKGVRLAATTHYAEIKMYALSTPGVENGSCEFDVETLSPTYRLLIGVPGRSNAFAISRRLGLPEEVIHRARELMSTENTRFEDVVDKLEQARQTLEKEQVAALSNRQQAEYIRQQIEAEKQRLQKQMEKEIAQARSQAQTMVERVRSQTDLLLNELEELKKQKDKEDFAAKVSAVRGSYKGRIEKLRDLADPVIRKKEEPYALPRPLKSGDTVLLADLGTEATVLSGPDSSGSYLVQAGILKTKVPADGLRLVEQPKKVTYQGQSQRRVRPEGGGGKGLKTQRPSMELDLRGMASDEGIMETDRFLDRCVLSGLTNVTIIHGKGTGVLRKAIREHLKRHPSVRSFRPGLYGEGEDGVTVVELK